MFKEKTLSYNLRSSQIITQPKFNSQTHGYHSLRNEGTLYGQHYQTVVKKQKILTPSSE